MLCETGYDGLRLATDSLEGRWPVERQVPRELTETDPTMESLMRNLYSVIKTAQVKKVEDTRRRWEEGGHVDEAVFFRVEEQQLHPSARAGMLNE